MGKTAVIIGKGKIRVRGDGLGCVLNGIVVLPSVEVGKPSAVVYLGVLRL